MSDKKEYIVVMKGCCLKGITEEKVGEKVMLSDTKALGMSGKVKLLKDYEMTSKTEQELIKENAKLTKQVEELTAQLDEATKPDAKPAKKDK